MIMIKNKFLDIDFKQTYTLSKILFIGLLAISINLNSQRDNLGKVFLKNGKVYKKGYSHLQATSPSKCGRIKYEGDDNLIFIHDCKDIEKIRRYSLDSLENIKDSTDFYYKYQGDKFNLIEKVKMEKGKLELFIEYYYSGGASVPFGFGGFTQTFHTSSPPSKIYSIGKQYNVKIEKLPRRKKSKKFKKAILKYTSKCIAFVKKIEDKNFIKENSVVEIIDFYNKNCK